MSTIDNFVSGLEVPNVATVTDYAWRVYHRADGIDEVVPSSFEPDWNDRPAMFAGYANTGTIALGGPDGLADRYTRLRSQAGQGKPRLDIAALSTLLYMVAAPLRRKLELSWNSKVPPTGFLQQEYRRGSASGGGLYPTQLYLICGGDPLPAGVYRYDPGHHRLIPLRRGDARAALATAANQSLDAPAQCYLVLTTDLWQNCFKYSNFGYHVCTQDVGAMLGTIRLVSKAFGISCRTRLRFDDAAIGNIVGAQAGQEFPLAIVAMGHGDEHPRATTTVMTTPVIRPRQRSRYVAIPSAIIELHRATVLRVEDVAIAEGAISTSGQDKSSPFDTTLLDRLPAVLLDRRSAWGSMRSFTPLSADRLHDLVAFVGRYGCAPDAIEDDAVPTGSIELIVQSLNVVGLDAGGYRWNPSEGSCERIEGSSPVAWQSTYAMLNYNLDEAACLIFVTGDLGCMIEQHGARGYRVLNARIGMIAQLAYTAAAALSLECGVVLGARAQLVKRLMAMPASREVMLAIYVGGLTTPSEGFDFQFLRCGEA